MRSRLLPLIFVLAGMACVSGRPSRAAGGEGAPVSSLTLSTGTVGAFGTAVIGSCERCGRPLYSAASSRNCRVVVFDHDSVAAVIWSGCLDCLTDILRKNP